MRAFAIEISNNPTSINGVKELIASSKKVGNEFEVERFVATTPENTDLQGFMDSKGIRWNWPLSGHFHDFRTGFKKHAYQAKYPSKVIACFISHYRLWEACVLMDENILVLEHDAYFLQKLDKELYDFPFVISINNPLGCTRKSRQYDEALKCRQEAHFLVPYIDADLTVPQGLPGNSAYVMTPRSASDLIGLVKMYGAWPNDAIMCRQLLPCYASKIYYTHIQGLRSTTTC